MLSCYQTLTNSEQFSSTIGGFYTNDVYYSDTDPLYFENEHWDKLDITGLVGKNQLQGKNDYIEEGIRCGLFLACNIKYCLAIKKFGVFDEHKTFRGLIVWVII